jgi:hypothetical protein
MINRKPLPASPAPLIMALEPRILLDGAAVVEAAEAMTDNDFAADSSIDVYAVAPDQSLTTRREVVFVDASLPDVETLIDGLDESAEVYLIEAYEDGLAQMIALLEGYENLDAIHILGHGDVAQANIGSTILSDGTLDANTNLLKQIGSFLSDDGDILLYGCNIAQGDEGEAFVDRIAQITQADIAASDDLTGDEAQGGNWELEATSGYVEASPILIKSYQNLLISTGNQYIENDPDTPIIDGTPISTDIGNYAGGYIEFELDSPNSTEDLVVIEDFSASTVNSEITIVGGTVYQGNGTDAVIIGNIDPLLNGQNGTVLRINLLTNYSNGDFSGAVPGSTSFEGWQFINSQFITGTTGTLIEGQPAPLDTTYPASNTTKDTDSTTTQAYATTISSTGNPAPSIELESTGVTSSNPYAVIRGPYIYSETAVPMQAGDTVSFDWQAQGGEDNYDVYGYIIDINDANNNYVLLNETGSTTTWQNESVTVTTSGQFRFVFIAGSYDASGGNALGARLYIDNIQVTQANPSSGVTQTSLQQISNKIAYSDPDNDLIDYNSDFTRVLKVTATKEDGNSTETLALFDIVPVNDAPTLTTDNHEGSFFTPVGVDPDYSSDNLIFYAASSTPVDIFKDINSDTIENNQSFIELTLTVDNVTYNTEEQLGINGYFFNLENDNSGTTNNVDYSVSVSAAKATVTLTFQSGLDSSGLSALISGLQYRNNNVDAFNSLNDSRLVTIKLLKDSGGTANNGDDTGTIVSQSATIKRLTVIDAGNSNYTENGQPADCTVTLQNLPNQTEILSAQITILENLTYGDTLEFQDTPDIESSFNPTTSLLVLSAVDPDNPPSIAEWTTALNSVVFYSTSDYPDENTSRGLSWKIIDADDSYPATTNVIFVHGINDLPAKNGILPSDTITIGDSHSQPAYRAFIDPDSNLLFSASGLPAGVNINSQTGVISGIPAEIGSYTINVTATDDTGATVNAGYTLTVIPVSSGSSSSSSNTSSSATGATTSEQTTTSQTQQNTSSSNTTPSSTTDSAGNETSGSDGTLGTSQSITQTTDNADSPVAESYNTILSIFNPSISQLSYSQPASQLTNSGFDSVTISIDSNGQLQINTSTGDSNQAGVSGMTVVDFYQEDNSIEVSINDANFQNGTLYTASLQNGQPLPSWLSIDPQTGLIFGEVPPGSPPLDIRVQAIDTDGTSRILDMELALPSQGQPLSLRLELSPPSSQGGFSHQLATHSIELENQPPNIIQALNTHKPA